jgi:hypothetical protein
MVCGSCEATIAQVSGKSGGHQGRRRQQTLARRTLPDKVILRAVQEQIPNPQHIAYVPRRVEEEIAKLRSDLPDAIKVKDAELTAEQRRLANFVDFIGDSRGSQALAKPLVETERRVDRLSDDVEALRRSREKIFRPPPIEWVKNRLSNGQQVLEQRAARSAQMLRNLLAPIRLELVTPTSAAPSTAPSRPSTRSPYKKNRPPLVRRAVRLLFKRWRRRELNPRPQSREEWRLRA